MSGLSLIATVPASLPPDWTGDPTLPTAAGVDIDAGTPRRSASEQPSAPTPRDSTLAGDNDWTRVALTFRRFPANVRVCVGRAQRVHRNGPGALTLQRPCLLLPATDEPVLEAALPWRPRSR